MYMRICKQNIVSIRGMGAVPKARECYHHKTGRGQCHPASHDIVESNKLEIRFLRREWMRVSTLSRAS